MAKTPDAARSQGLVMRTFAQTNCPVCGGPGTLLYEGLVDRLFGAPGSWNHRHCQSMDCALVWLDPCPLSEDLHLAYIRYFTHGGGADAGRSNGGLDRLLRGLMRIPRSLVRIPVRWLEKAYLRRTYGIGGPGWNGQAGLFSLFPQAKADADFRQAYLADSPRAKLMEVGCGDGSLLQRLKDRGFDAEGIDIDPGAVAQARSKGLKVGLGDLASARILDASYDFVVASHAIEHVPDPLALLVECNRILKPGGSAVFITPNIESFGHRAFKQNWLHLDPPRHLHLFTVASLRRLGLDAGFAKVETRTAPRDARTLFHASREIASSGTFVWGKPLSALRWVWASGLLIQEACSLRRRPNQGEEIILYLVSNS